tara:strand:- start:213 stop:407 length:195 start_codon:yes stop_codon:yes gene_type:complete
MKGSVFAKMMIFFAAATIKMCVGQDDIYEDRVQTHKVVQNPPGYYFFQAYVGSPFQNKSLLIDT